MRQYQSKEEGVWSEIVAVALTEEQKNILSNRNQHPPQTVRAVLDVFRQQMLGPVHEEMSQLLTTFYNTKKPEINESDTYQLIAIDINEDQGDFTGILNCRVNGEHIQIRF